MTLDEQVKGFADKIIEHGDIVKAELRRARSGQLSLNDFDVCRRRMVAAVGAIKAETLRALRAGLMKQLETELRNRGFGAPNDA